MSDKPQLIAVRAALAEAGYPNAMVTSDGEAVTVTMHIDHPEWTVPHAVVQRAFEVAQRAWPPGD